MHPTTRQEGCKLQEQNAYLKGSVRQNLRIYFRKPPLQNAEACFKKFKGKVVLKGNTFSWRKNWRASVTRAREGWKSFERKVESITKLSRETSARENSFAAESWRSQLRSARTQNLRRRILFHAAKTHQRTAKSVRPSVQRSKSGAAAICKRKSGWDAANAQFRTRKASWNAGSGK